MKFKVFDLIKDTNNVDLDDICSCWQWRLNDMKAIVLITCLGDLFFIGNDESIYRLQTDGCEFTKVAANFNQFEQLINDEKFDEWLLPQLVEQLIEAGKALKENEVYSYKKMPVIGGEYSVENIEPTDMSVHFAFCGQICEQIEDLPDGTKVGIKIGSKKGL
jgi:hypothetical protein